MDRDLETWDCVSCNLCVTVCPNDAMLHLATPAGVGMTEKWQYFCLAEWCNDCGNCTTFCPERVIPSRVKPRVFLDREAFALDGGPGYLVIVVGDGALVVEVRSGRPVGDPAHMAAFLPGDEGFRCGWGLGVGGSVSSPKGRGGSTADPCFRSPP